MQFSCESCKTALQIADEKLRGKRLVVRCTRCGSKITISDPALAAGASPRIAAPATQTLAPQRSAAARVAPSASRPATAGAPKRRDTDTESTRAMDSDLLEKALEASKRDDAASAGLASLDPDVPSSGPPKPLRKQAAPAAAPRDPPIWFAMLSGKQTGPLTRAEVGIKIEEGAVGPRTYLWKDGMASWERAKDLPDLSAMFAPLPEPPRPGAPPPAASAARGFREFSTTDFGDIEPGTGAQKLVENPEAELDFGGSGGDRGRSRSKPQPAELHAEPRAGLAPPIAKRTPDALELAQVDSHDGEDRTNVDPLPLGERVHQESVAEELFPINPETAGHSGLDLATDEPTKKKRASSPAAPKVSQPTAQARPTPRAAQPRQELMFANAAPTRGSPGPVAVAIALCILAALAVLLWFFVGPGSERPADEAPAVHKPAVQPHAAAPRAEARQPEKKPPVEKPAPAAAPVERAATQTGGLTPGQVRRKLAENKGALQGCIDQALRVDPSLRVGRIHITTRIAPTGRVTTAKIDKRTVDGSPLGACLKRATRSIVFPSFTGDPFEVEIPIVVTAGE